VEAAPRLAQPIRLAAPVVDLPRRGPRPEVAGLVGRLAGVVRWVAPLETRPSVVLVAAVLVPDATAPIPLRQARADSLEAVGAVEGVGTGALLAAALVVLERMALVLLSAINNEALPILSRRLPAQRLSLREHPSGRRSDLHGDRCEHLD
jgi:hypothetical protein